MKLNLIIPSYNRKEYFKNLFFMHPKSGGTTIDHIFAKLSSILKHLIFIEQFNKDIDAKLELTKKTKILPKFISGHLNYDFCDQFEHIYRYSGEDPIDRVISDYKFNIHSNRLSPNDISLNDFIKDQVNNHRDNLMTTIFWFVWKDEIIKFNHYEKAIKNLNYLTAYTFNNWDNFLSDILSNFSFPSILYSKYQSHNYNFNFTPNKILKLN